MIEYLHSGDFLECSEPEAYIIAMPDKEGEAKKVVEKLGLQGRTRGVKAVNLKTIKPELLVRDGYVDKKYNETEKKKAALGCHLSHMLVLQEFLKSGKKTALVLEEDLSFPRGEASAREELKSFMEKSAEALDSEEPMISYAGYCYCNGKGDEIRQGLYKLDAPMCTHAYMINRPAAQRFIKEGLPQTRPVDHMYGVSGITLIGPESPIIDQPWIPYHGNGFKPGTENDKSVKPELSQAEEESGMPTYQILLTVFLVMLVAGLAIFVAVKISRPESKKNA